MKKETHTNALTLGFLTPFYDSIVNFLGFGNYFYRKIASQIDPQSRGSILDVGTGTANLALTIKRRCPKAKVIAVDPDENILKIARRKIQKEKIDINLVKAYAQKLPFNSGTFDWIVSSFVIHHIPKPFKKQAFLEMKRVLKPEGKILIIDFGQPKNILANLVTWLASFVEDVGPNRKGLIPMLLSESGFKDIKELDSKFGLISFYKARKA